MLLQQNLLGKDLRKGLNQFKINIRYEDKNGRNYQEEDTFTIQLTNVSLIQNIALVSNNLIRSLENFTLQTSILVIVGSLVVFMIVIWLVFKKKK